MAYVGHSYAAVFSYNMIAHETTTRSLVGGSSTRSSATKAKSAIVVKSRSPAFRIAATAYDSDTAT